MKSVLEQEFEQELVRTYKIAAQHGYHATYFMQMLAEKGGVGTAEHLLGDDKVQSGLFRLKEEGLLHLSVESLVLNPRFSELFLSKHKRAAKERLQVLGYTLDSPDQAPLHVTYESTVQNAMPHHHAPEIGSFADADGYVYRGIELADLERIAAGDFAVRGSSVEIKFSVASHNPALAYETWFNFSSRREAEVFASRPGNVLIRVKLAAVSPEHVCVSHGKKQVVIAARALQDVWEEVR